MSVAKWCFVLLLGLLTSFSRCEDSNATLGIEPTAETLPANFLKFYLHFSEPMERGDVFRYLSLLKVNPEGTEEEVVEPFREVELWSADFQSLTLWLHPGRQKPGVNLNVDLGPVLAEGSKYRLVVSPEWKTESGGKLAGILSKTFHAGGSDLEQPDPSRWSISRLSDQRLLIETDGAVDSSSLRKRLRVMSPFLKGDAQVGAEVSGNRVILKAGMKPVVAGRGLRAWDPGPYRIEIDPQLEDLAGNSIARLFNLDLEKYPHFVEKTESTHISFTITESFEVKITSP